jgi:hypothetical protein
MTFDYEAVKFGSGRVQPGNPLGFALDHYDRTPSPLSVAGGGTPTLLGPGGVLAGVADVFGDISTGRWKESPLDFLSTAISAVNTYQNAKSLTKTGVNAELTNATTNALRTVGNQGISGIKGTNFPMANTTTTTTATSRNITGG